MNNRAMAVIAIVAIVVALGLVTWQAVHRPNHVPRLNLPPPSPAAAPVTPPPEAGPVPKPVVLRPGLVRGEVVRLAAPAGAGTGQ